MTKGEDRSTQEEWDLRYDPVGTLVPASGWRAVFQVQKGDKSKEEAFPIVAWVLCKVFEELHILGQPEPVETKRYANKVCGLVDAGDEGLEVVENLASHHFMTPYYGFFLRYERVGIFETVRNAVFPRRMAHGG
jgi:hypothetical protein